MQISDVHIDMLYLVPLVGTILPILVALVTKKVASPSVKGVVLALLSALGGLGTAAIADAGAISKEAFVNAFVMWVVGVATYFGLWSRPAAEGKRSVAETVADVAPNTGIG